MISAFADAGTKGVCVTSQLALSLIVPDQPSQVLNCVVRQARCGSMAYWPTALEAEQLDFQTECHLFTLVGVILASTMDFIGEALNGFGQFFDFACFSVSLVTE
jgi:hypothetical protein